MIVYLVKFIHLVFAVSLIAMTMYAIGMAGSKLRINKGILITSLFAMLTGTLLVLPKSYTFHTPWIQAAYLFLFIFCLGILCLNKIPARYRWVSRCSYMVLLGVLIAISHDAVTKSTFIL